jgi:hypothetical protein
MRVRDWQDILEDVTSADADPDDWRAVAGSRRRGLGEDMFVGHPAVGLFQLKTYARNPYDVKGVGAEVARKVDGDLADVLPNREDSGRFAVQTPPEDEDHAKEVATRLEETLKVHSEAPTTGEDLFQDVMEAMESPAFGPMDYEFDGRPEALDELTDTFEEAEALLDAELDDLVERDGVGRGFE